jgi:hypothetical protein
MIIQVHDSYLQLSFRNQNEVCWSILNIQNSSEYNMKTPINETQNGF